MLFKRESQYRNWLSSLISNRRPANKTWSQSYFPVRNRVTSQPLSAVVIDVVTLQGFETLAAWDCNRLQNGLWCSFQTGISVYQSLSTHGRSAFVGFWAEESTSNRRYFCRSSIHATEGRALAQENMKHLLWMTQYAQGFQKSVEFEHAFWGARTLKAKRTPHANAFIIFDHLSTLQKLQKIPGKFPIASLCWAGKQESTAVTVLGLLLLIGWGPFSTSKHGGMAVGQGRSQKMWLLLFTQATAPSAISNKRKHVDLLTKKRHIHNIYIYK